MKKIRINCPVCKKNRIKVLPLEELTSRGGGLLSILIEANEDCPHVLIAFIDQNHAVRGVQIVDFAPSLIKQEEMSNLIPPKEMSIRGAYKVFGELLIDIISGILQHKNTVFCGDVESSMSLFGIISKILPEILSIGEQLVIIEQCYKSDKDTLIINTQLKVKESGNISTDAHTTIQRYFKEAEQTGDDEAAIIYLRQKLSILTKVEEFLEKNLIEKKSEENVIKDIDSNMHVKIKSDELHTVCLILNEKGKKEIVDKIILSKLNNNINGNIRGTQTPDYELKFTTEDEKRDLSSKPGIEILILFYDKEIFCKLFRTGLLYNEICIITENKLLNNLKIIFGKIFGLNYMQKVVFTSLDEYNEKHRKRLLNSEFQNSFIINIDNRTIIKQPYNNDFQKKDFKLEMSILNDIKEHTLNHEIIIDILKSKYDRILDAIIELKGFIEKKVLPNRSKIDEWLNKLLIKKLDIKAETIYEILRNRFNIIIG